MTAPNNALLYNAAIEGYLAGQLRDRRLTAVNTGTPPAIGTPDASYAALASEATNWAVEMDGATANDHAAAPVPAGTIPISVITTGVAIVANTDATGNTQFAEIIKSRLLGSCSLAMFESRYYAGSAPLSSANFAALSANVEAMYTTLASLVLSGATGHNVLLVFAALAGGTGAIFGKTQAFVVDSTFEESLAFVASLAAAIDPLIALDATISQTGGMPLEPTTGPITAAQLGKTRLMQSLVLAYMESRATGQLIASVPTGAPVTAWGVSQAPIIVAAYNALVGGLLHGSTNPGNNTTLYNEAYCAFIAANLAGRPFTSTNSADANYVAVGAAATAFANEVDLAVGGPDISGTPVPAGTQFITVGVESANGSAVPSTGPIQEGILGKTGLMWAICRGSMHGRPLLGNTLDTTSSTYSAAANSIVALYLEMATVLIAP